MVQFFGGHVSESKTLSLQVPTGNVLTIVNVALASGSTAVLSVETTGADNKTIKVALCTLRSKAVEQVKLDIVFGAAKTKLSVVGDGSVHLSGYYQSGPPEVSTEQINKLTVDDLQDMVQKAAVRIVKKDQNTAVPSKKRPAPAQDDNNDAKKDAENTKSQEKAQAQPNSNQQPQQNGEERTKRRKKNKNKRNKQNLTVAQQ
ncbi:hypothetical protein THRCLA_09491 [Thraustotheca clavata]|uniref:Nucleoplasmin-like domain-containing protein n=1 Tax=Thraustotheca clavata TaxID=74557 RepID=A0A1V9YWP0_9STRA|nr:hypothetical protein THRCLA_09491 [Thraustotheca clavata]